MHTLFLIDIRVLLVYLWYKFGGALKKYKFNLAWECPFTIASKDSCFIVLKGSFLSVAINKSFFGENQKSRGNINPVASNKLFLYNQIFILQDVELIL